MKKNYKESMHEKRKEHNFTKIVEKLKKESTLMHAMH